MFLSGAKCAGTFKAENLARKRVLYNIIAGVIINGGNLRQRNRLWCFDARFTYENSLSNTREDSIIVVMYSLFVCVLHAIARIPFADSQLRGENFYSNFNARLSQYFQFDIKRLFYDCYVGITF